MARDGPCVIVLDCCSKWEAGVSYNAKSECDEGVPAGGRANVHRGRQRHGAFRRENAPSWTRLSLGNLGQTGNPRPLEPFTPHDQNPELIRTNGEGGRKHSSEDARQFVLINVAEGKAAGPFVGAPWPSHFCHGLCVVWCRRVSEGRLRRRGDSGQAYVSTVAYLPSKYTYFWTR